MLQLFLLLTLVSVSIATKNEAVHAKYKTLPRNEFIEYFNHQNFSWKITHHRHLDGKKLTGVKVGNLDNLPVKRHFKSKFSLLPENFDSRTKWPNCASISEIYDQGNCGSCWVFGIATVASDRTCIHTYQPVRLSEQDFVCLQSAVCNGGYLDQGYAYWRDSGLVTTDCLPYDVNALKNGATCDYTCTSGGLDYSSDKHYGSEIYTIPNNNFDIEAELFMNGPITASFVVYDDFRDYHSGVYEHTYGNIVGLHAVRIIGYGKEYNVDYWLIANSWNSRWGESGFAKIKRFQENIFFENSLITGLPDY